ncbi:S1C family serine protease [Methanomassiliicoccus luminyensis]|uniref:S1C family serine protease n=2 Tax=Methanomassiliicoccus luminyensis TaxID=1080712 RepID=UPI0009DA576E|nr:trypsin-like peptidase domain-containing protein [Methanomassiliicoccus luminyensis]
MGIMGSIAMLDIEGIYISAVEKGAGSTVSVRTTGARGGCRGPYFQRSGVGSGIVLDDRGHILTNNHVVAGAERIVVVLGNGNIHEARVIGSDERTDIAVLGTDAKELAPAELGDSDALRVGQPILAIGSPLGLAGGPTVTSGVVSSLHRNLWMSCGNGLSVIQTDAPVNPGNSGGPLVDLSGRVIALTAAQVLYADGIGFAIPINLAKKVSEQIIQHGSVRRPRLGIVAIDVLPRIAYQFRLPNTLGVFVTDVLPGSAAEAAGLRIGDVILAIGEERLGGVHDLLAALGKREVGAAVEMEVRRNGRTERISADLGANPD